MNNKNMVALNEEQLEKVDGGFVLSIFACTLIGTLVSAASGVAVGFMKKYDII